MGGYIKEVRLAECTRAAGLSDKESGPGKYDQQCSRLWNHVKESQEILPNPVDTVNLNPAVGALSPPTSSQSTTSSRWSTSSGGSLQSHMTVATSFTDHLASKLPAGGRRGEVSIRRVTPTKESRDNVTAAHSKRQDTNESKDIRKSVFKVGTLLLASTRDGDNILEGFATADNCAFKINTMFGFDVLASRELSKGVKNGLADRSPPRRGRQNEIPDDDFKNLCCLVFTASSIQQANCYVDRFERTDLMSAVGQVVNDTRKNDGQDAMNDTALFRRIENANCRMQDLKHIDKREALRVKWLTHGAQKKKYEKWEETAVEYGFAGPAADDAER